MTVLSKITNTYTATIYVGSAKEPVHTTEYIDKVTKLCQAYVDRVGLCVTVTPTQFIYTNGGEFGVAVGLINYPRFPKHADEIKKTALDLAGILKKELNQKGVSVVCTDETIWLHDEDKK